MNNPADRLRLHPVTDHEAGHTCIEIDPQDGRLIGRAEDGWLAHPSHFSTTRTNLPSRWLLDPRGYAFHQWNMAQHGAVGLR